MKKGFTATRSILLGAIITIAGFVQAKAQQVSVPLTERAYYGWNTTSLTYDIKPAAEGVVFSQITMMNTEDTANTSANASTSGIKGNYWPLVDVPDMSKYVHFNFSTDNATTFNLTGLTLTLQRSATGPDSFIIKYSTDGFVTSHNYMDTAATVPTASADIFLTLDTAIAVGPNSNFEIRVYPYSATGSAGTFRVNNATRISGYSTFNTDYTVTTANAYSNYDDSAKAFLTVPQINGLTFSPVSLSNVNSSMLTNTGGIKVDHWPGASAPDSTAYFQFSAQADDTTAFTLKKFIFQTQRSSTGPDSAAILYSFDSFATPGTALVPTLAPLNDGNYNQALYLALNSPLTIDSGKTATFRVYPFHATGTSGTFRFNDGVAFIGDYGTYTDTTPVTPPDTTPAPPTSVPELHQANAFFHIAGNPVWDNFSILFDLPETGVVLSLFDMNGHKTAIHELAKVANGTAYNVSLNTVPSGTYILHIAGRQHQGTVKIIKR